MAKKFRKKKLKFPLFRPNWHRKHVFRVFFRIFQCFTEFSLGRHKTTNKLIVKNIQILDFCKKITKNLNRFCGRNERVSSPLNPMDMTVYKNTYIGVVNTIEINPVAPGQEKKIIKWETLIEIVSSIVPTRRNAAVNPNPTL